MPRKGEGRNAPTILAEIRHVYRKPKSTDRTEGHKRWRALMEEDFKEFMRVMERHEAQFRKESREAKAAEGEKSGFGSSGAATIPAEPRHGKVEELLGKLMGEFSGKDPA